MNFEKENSCRKRELLPDCDVSCTPCTTVILRALQGAHKNRTFELRVRQAAHKSQKRWLIGRKPVPISFPKDNEVSSKHGELTFFFDSQQVHITDLGSTNGTKINGKLIPAKIPCLLHLGDTFTVGASQVVFEEVRQPVHPNTKQHSPNKKHKLIASPTPNSPAMSGTNVKSVACPICDQPLTDLDVRARAHHINRCVDEESDTACDANESRSGASSTVNAPLSATEPEMASKCGPEHGEPEDTVNDASIALAISLQNEDGRNYHTPVGDGAACIYTCSMCGKNMSHLSELRRQIHINHCCDKAEKNAKKLARLQKKLENERRESLALAQRNVWERAADITICILCKKDLAHSSLSKDRVTHLKFCAKMKGNLTAEQVEEFLTAHKEKRAKKQSLWSWMTSKSTSPSNSDSAFQSPFPPSKSKKKKRTFTKNLNRTDSGQNETLERLKAANKEARGRRSKRVFSEKTEETEGMRMDANLATAIALSESLAAAEKDPEVPMDDRIIAVARLERRIAYMDGQIDVLTSQRAVLAYNLERHIARLEETNTAVGQTGTKLYGSGQVYSPTRAMSSVVYSSKTADLVNSNKPPQPSSGKGHASKSTRFDDFSRTFSSLPPSRLGLASANKYVRASTTCDLSPPSIVPAASAEDDTSPVEELSYESESEDENGAPCVLSQLVAEVEDDVEENTSDTAHAAMWIRNAPEAARLTFPNWEQDIEFVFQQNVPALRAARRNMLQKKLELESCDTAGTTDESIAVGYFLALIGCAIEVLKKKVERQKTSLLLLPEEASLKDPFNATGQLHEVQPTEMGTPGVNDERCAAFGTLEHLSPPASVQKGDDVLNMVDLIDVTTPEKQAGLRLSPAQSANTRASIADKLETGHSPTVSCLHDEGVNPVNRVDSSMIGSWQIESGLPPATPPLNSFDCSGLNVGEEEELPSTERQIASFIRSDKDLYEKILTFQTISVRSLHMLLKANSIKITKKELQSYLDSKNVTNSWE